MSWSRGLALLAETRTGQRMLGGAAVSSAGVGLALNRKAGLSSRASLASAAVLGFAQVAAIAYFGHRLVRAGEQMAVRSGLAGDPAPSHNGASAPSRPPRLP